MNAVRLRNLMLIGIGLIVVLIGLTIYYASSFLRAETIKTAHTKIDAELGARDLERLKKLQKILRDNETSVQKAEQIVSASKQYQYQDQIINDINSYAAKTGVKVTAYDFISTTSASSRSTKQPAVSGVKTITVNLTLQSPMLFDDYLRFIKAVEQNLTKMQVSGINLTPDAKDINSVANPGIALTVYVR